MKAEHDHQALEFSMLTTDPRVESGINIANSKAIMRRRAS